MWFNFLHYVDVDVLVSKKHKKTNKQNFLSTCDVKIKKGFNKYLTICFANMGIKVGLMLPLSLM